MKYIITTIYFGKNGGVFFDAANNVEVFDHYVSALRYLVGVKKVSLKVNDKVTVWFYDGRFGLHRQEMMEMIAWRGACHTIITLAKINVNGIY